MSEGVAEVRLALDTVSDRLSVAAQADRGRRVHRSLAGARRHAASLLPVAEEVLSEVDARPADVTHLALGDGPGSFTGLRVGAAFAKALVVSQDARLCVAASLLVRASGSQRSGETVMAMSNALRGEVFAGVWTLGPDRVTEIVRPRAFDAVALLALPRPDVVVGEAPDAIGTEVTRAWGTVVEPAWPDAETLLRLMTVPGGCRAIEAPDRWEPDYGRPAEAQARWEREHGRTLPGSPGDTR